MPDARLVHLSEPCKDLAHNLFDSVLCQKASLLYWLLIIAFLSLLHRVLNLTLATKRLVLQRHQACFKELSDQRD